MLKNVKKKSLLKIHESNQIIPHGNETVNFKSDAQHISPIFFNIINNNAKHPNINPAQPCTSNIIAAPATDVSTRNDTNSETLTKIKI